MARFKDFGGAVSSDTEPLSFKLYDEEFDARPQIQGKLLLDLVSDTQGDDSVASATVIKKFFERVLLPESYTRFESLLDSPDKIVSVERLGEITAWLIEEYTNRPEQPAGV